MAAETSKAEDLPWSAVPRTLWFFLGKSKARFITLSAVLFAVFFYTVVPPYIIGKVVDFFTSYRAGDSLKPFYIYASVLGVSYVTISLIRLYTKNALKKVAIAARVQARIRGFERLIHLSLEWHAEENTGNKVQRIFAGSEAIYQWIQITNKDVFRIVAAFVGILGFFLLQSVEFLAFLVGYSAMFFCIEYVFNRQLARLSIKLDSSKEAESGIYVEQAGNMLAIQALGASKSVRHRLKNVEERTEDIEFRLSDTASRKWYWFQSLNGLAYAAFLFLVGYLFVKGQITLGAMLAFYAYFERLKDAAGDSSDLGLSLIQLKTDMARMMPIFVEGMQVETGTGAFPRHWQEIRIQESSFHYPTGQTGFADFNFTLRQGEKLGVAGASGSGKSTLVKVLLGLYGIEKGTFFVDGKDYYSLSHEEITKNMAVVLQETELFNLSLRDNITLTRKFDEELFARSIHIADLEEVIKRLPKGLETLIGERGYSLSGGERQRLGIARAVYKDAPLFILDEATSSLDSKTEAKVMKRLFSGTEKSKTFLVIAHRLSTLSGMDRVMVIEKGKVVEEGAFGTLARKTTSRFGRLYKLQSRGGKI